MKFKQQQNTTGKKKTTENIIQIHKWKIMQAWRLIK